MNEIDLVIDAFVSVFDSMSNVYFHDMSFLYILVSLMAIFILFRFISRLYR